MGIGRGEVRPVMLRVWRSEARVSGKCEKRDFGRGGCEDAGRRGRGGGFSFFFLSLIHRAGVGRVRGNIPMSCLKATTSAERFELGVEES